MRLRGVWRVAVLLWVALPLWYAGASAGTITVGSGGAGVSDVDSLLAMYPLDDNQPFRSDVIAYDSTSSMYLTQVQSAMESHRHLAHDENVWIIRGAGRLTLGGEKYRVKAGQVIHIPRNTPHAFHNLGSSPAVAVSVFSPGFDGKDTVSDPTPKADASQPKK